MAKAQTATKRAAKRAGPRRPYEYGHEYGSNVPPISAVPKAKAKRAAKKR